MTNPHKHVHLVIAGRIADPTTPQVTPAEMNDLRLILQALDLHPQPGKPPAPTTSEPPVKKQTRKTPAVLDTCGSRYGYRKHIKLGQEACADCKEANRVYVNDWKQGVRASGRELEPCGTEAAYRRHRRKGEPIDWACREANARAGREKKARQRARRELAAA